MQQWKGEKNFPFAPFASLTILLAARLLSHDFSPLSTPPLSIPADNELKKGRRGGSKSFPNGKSLSEVQYRDGGRRFIFFLMPLRVLVPRPGANPFSHTNSGPKTQVFCIFC